MERITRTITTSTVYPAVIHYNGPDNITFEDLPGFTANGKIDTKKAEVMTRKRLQTRTTNIVIKDIVYESHTYSMSLENFIEYAERMD